MSERALVKAFIKPKDGGDTLTCRFNPSEYTISKSGNWQKTPTKAARSAPTPEFTGANPRNMQMELFFDGWEGDSGDVSRDVDTLLEWTNPTQKSLGDNKPNPPILVFHWGPKSYFDAYLKQVSAKFTLFGGDGTPLRATANVTLEEVPDEPGAQNPSSGGVAGRRTHVVLEGDTLHSIAFGEYGDPALWRGVAAANGVDDPLRLAPGTRLLVPPRAEAEAVS
jgi:nucleoid-associated protein YgaU